MGNIQILPRLLGKNFLNGRVCKSCVTLAMVYGSETWCVGQNRIGTLQRIEGTMMRSMCGVKLMGKKSTKDLM